MSGSDAGLYFAKVYGSSDTGVNTTFYVNITNHGDKKGKKAKASTIVPLVLLVAMSSIAVVCGVIGGVVMLIGRVMFKRSQRKKGRHSKLYNN